MFYLLQCAEGERCAGNVERARQLVPRALHVERDRRRWQGSRTGRLAARLILAAAQSEQTHATDARPFEALIREFDRIGAALPAARARCDASIVTGQPIPEDVWGVTLLVDGRYQEGTTGRDVYESQEVH